MSSNELFPFTEEHEMIRQAARDFAQKEIVPIAAEFDESGDFPYETIMKMGEMGFMGIEVPEEYGGAGMDTLAYVLALEEICKADAAHGIIMSVNNSLYCYGILKFGSEAQGTDSWGQYVFQSKNDGTPSRSGIKDWGGATAAP